MLLQRWDPFNELRQMQDTMNRLWRGFTPSTFDHEMESWSVPLDVVQEGDNIIVQASLPGVNPEDVQVTIEENVLTIKGQTKMEYERKEGSYLMRERRTGSFHRSLRLPDTADTAKAEPYYEHGVLTVTIPKAEAKKAKQLTINVGKGLNGSSK